MTGVVLELFPGLGVLGMGFAAEGFTVVKGPDVLWGGDIRTWDARPLAGRVDGIIGGDPCQSHSSLANLVRAKGLEPRFGDLTGEYQRVVEEVRPAWFLRENVPQTPWILPKGYAVRRFELEHSHLGPVNGEGQVQMRRRAFWFGVPGERWDDPVPELRGHIEHCFQVLPEPEAGVMGGTGTDPSAYRRQQAVASDARAVAVAVGGSGKLKRTRQTAVGGNQGFADLLTPRQRSVTGRHHSNELRTTQERGAGAISRMPKRSLPEMLELQGLPPDLFEHAPYTVQACRKLVGNCVPKPMSVALARAVKKVMASWT